MSIRLIINILEQETDNYILILKKNLKNLISMKNLLLNNNLNTTRPIGIWQAYIISKIELRIQIFKVYISQANKDNKATIKKIKLLKKLWLQMIF